MRHMRRSEETLLLGIVYQTCECPKPCTFEEAVRFRCRCGAAGVLSEDVAERLGERRKQLAETRRLRGNQVGARS
jgi:hypothetical protein